MNRTNIFNGAEEYWAFRGMEDAQNPDVEIYTQLESFAFPEKNQTQSCMNCYRMGYQLGLLEMIDEIPFYTNLCPLEADNG